MASYTAFGGMKVDMGKPFFLFIGEADREGVVSKIKTSGFEYIKKRLESKVENWRKIQGHLRDDNLRGTLLKLNTNTFGKIISPGYIEDARVMLQLVSEKPNVVFIHESFFLESAPPRPAKAINPSAPWEEEYDDDPRSFFDPVAPETKAAMTALLEEFPSLNLVPFDKNVEVSVLSQEFVDQNENNLLFRVYIPQGQIWSSETDKILRLFRDYLTNVAGVPVRQKQYTTQLGTVFELVGDDGVNAALVSEEFGDFSRLVELCISDPREAATMLEEHNVAAAKVADIIDRFAKEGRRLQVDLKQERERRVLSIRHRMEAELIDVDGTGVNWAAVNALIETQIPSIAGFSSGIGLISAPAMAPTAPVTIINNGQIFGKVSGVVASEIGGNVNVGPEAQDLLALAQAYGGQKSRELTSAVYELEDEQAKPAARLSARQRLKQFLFSLGGRGLDVGTGVLQSYIESKLGL